LSSLQLVQVPVPRYNGARPKTQGVIFFYVKLPCGVLRKDECSLTITKENGMRTILSLVGVVLLVLSIIALTDAAQAGRHRHSTTISGGTDMEKGSGQLTTERREVGAFERIESNIGANITVTIGKPQSVSVTYDDNLMEYVTTKVKAGTLIIESNHSFSSVEDCEIKIVVPRLELINVGGSGRIEIDGLDADRFTVEIDGSADVVANGKAGELDIEVNGSGNVDTRDLIAGEASVEINGSGDVNLMARDYLTANINGSGDIVYTGDPGHVVKSVNGSGRIRHR
jgi:hypothetical protein